MTAVTIFASLFICSSYGGEGCQFFRLEKRWGTQSLLMLQPDIGGMVRMMSSFRPRICPYTCRLRDVLDCSSSKTPSAGRTESDVDEIISEGFRLGHHLLKIKISFLNGACPRGQEGGPQLCATWQRYKHSLHTSTFCLRRTCSDNSFVTLTLRFIAHQGVLALPRRTIRAKRLETE